MKTVVSIPDLPAEELLQKRKRFRRELLEQGRLQPIKIAILGGTTTNEVADLLELCLLNKGFKPEFWQSEYNKFYEDAVLEPEKIGAFQPDLVYLHTHYLNLERFPTADTSEAQLEELVAAEAARFHRIWDSLQRVVPGQIIQNNFEHPPFPVLGNLDGVVAGGQTRFIYELNLQFSRAAAGRKNVIIQDLNALAAYLGYSRWFDWNRWYSYKILTTPEGSLAIARSLTAMIGSMFGRLRKCLVLDLDNTLWGGVIGDDGLEKLQLGKETALAEAYTAFQSYCLSLRERGIVLAVCSKNDPEIARTGFTHPDSVLKLEHFASFQANWLPKSENIQTIARELNLGLDSFVFVDDNPAERGLVAAQLPEVAVPDVGSDVVLYPGILQAGRYFEPVSLSREDFGRAASYSANADRTRLEAQFSDYGAYLESLEMHAEIEPFRPIYLERITQLINKTNQFNLTTRRYTFAEIEQISRDEQHLTLYGKLVDRYGDNGLISVLIGRREQSALHMDLWIMSCRVLKRDMEIAMLDTMVEQARSLGLERIIGYYRRTPKNAMVQDHYGKLGFELISAEGEEASTWSLPVVSYSPRNRHIKIRTSLHGQDRNYSAVAADLR